MPQKGNININVKIQISLLPSTEHILLVWAYIHSEFFLKKFIYLTQISGV